MIHFRSSRAPEVDGLTASTVLFPFPASILQRDPDLHAPPIFPEAICRDKAVRHSGQIVQRCQAQNKALIDC